MNVLMALTAARRPTTLLAGQRLAFNSVAMRCFGTKDLDGNEIPDPRGYKRMEFSAFS